MTKDALGRVLAIASAEADPDKLQQDEHLRYALYGTALDSASVEKTAELLAAILDDDDRTMSEAAIAAYLDRLGNVDSMASFDARHETLRHAVAASRFLTKRVQEWRLRWLLRTGASVPANDLVEASDWLQRAASEEAANSDLVALLSHEGRTKRVRAAAARRLPTMS